MKITGVALPQNQNDVEHSSCYIAIANGAGFSVGDKIIKILYHNITTSAITFSWYNDTQNIILTTPPLLSQLTPCGEKFDVEVEKYYHTDLSTGEITNILQHIVYDGNGIEVNRFYTDYNSNTIFTPSGHVGFEPKRLVIGEEVVTATNVTLGFLTPPQFATCGVIDIKPFNDIKISFLNNPVPGIGGIGHLMKKNEVIKLKSEFELQTFKFIAVDSSNNAEIFVTYFNTDLEYGI